MAALKELIGDKFIKRDGTATTFDESIKGNDLIGLYFSAHWCGPCKYFTPILKESYTKWKKDGQKISIIFGSLDSDEKSFKEYFATHGDYLAFEFGEKNGKVKQLMDKYKIRGIPTLVILDKDGKTIATDARIAVQGAKAEAINEWIPKPASIADGCYSIQCQHSGKVLAIEGGNKSEGAKLVQYESNGEENQQFLIKYNQKKSKYTIQPKHSNLYLDVAGSSKNNCVSILQWSHHGGNNQHFEIVSNGDGTYRIDTHCGKVLDVSSSSQENNASVLQYQWHGGKNQRFILKDIEASKLLNDCSYP